MIDRQCAAVFFCLFLTLGMKDIHAQDDFGSLKFETGDCTLLKSRVVRAHAMGRGTTAAILEIEVKNRSGFSAEPLVFLVEALAKKGQRRGKKKATPLAPVKVARVPLPHFGRAGRAVADGSAVKYKVRSPFANNVKKFKITVLEASFFVGKTKSKAPIKVIGKKEGEIEEFGQKYACTIVRLKNLSAFPVDAIFEATYTWPRKAKSIISCRLGASETKEWTISTLPQAYAGSELTGASVSKLKLIDWSVRASDGKKIAQEQFLSAWKNWRGTQTRTGSILGNFQLNYVAAANKGAPTMTKGRFEFTPGGEFHVTVSEGKSKKRTVDLMLQKVFCGMVRPSSDELKKSNQFRMANAHSVILVGPLWDKNANQNLFEIKDGAIVRRTSEENPEANFEKWETKKVEDGWLLTELDWYSKSLGTEPNRSLRWRYQELAGHYIPTYYQDSVSFGGNWFSTTEFKISNISISKPKDLAKAQPAKPSDSALKKIWNSSYRYPRTPVTLTGKFEIKSPGTDGVWSGKKVVTGSFRLNKFRGMLMIGERWQEASFKIDGRHSDFVRKSLVSAVEDRLRMWAFRDWAGRESFDSEFSQAKIVVAEDGKSSFRFSDAKIFESLQQRADKSLLLGLPGPRQRIVEFGKVGDFLVPIRIKTGDEILSATFKDMGSGWVMPVRMRFERVFGADWDPETLVLTDLELTP